MQIRIAILDDLEKIDEIYNQAISQKFKTADTEPFKPALRLHWFHQHLPDKYPIFVAEKDRQVIGWISLSPYRLGRKALQFTTEVSYYVATPFHGQGIASAMLNHVITIAPEYKFKNLFAILMEKNIASIRLLEKFNFKIWGYLPAVAQFDDETCGQYYYGINLEALSQ